MQQVGAGLQAALSACPLVAILRGLTPAEAPAIGDVLVEAGFRIIEVPLNSPDPMDSIRILAERFGGQAVIGAGTVRRVAEVAAVREAGGRLIVMPHSDTRVIGAAKAAGMFAVPGMFTPTEAFAALDAGADALKLFPAEAAPSPVLKALKAVLPKSVPVLPVGGVTPDRLAAYWDAGARGFGLGSALYRPGMDVAAVAAAAAEFMAAVRALAA